MISIGIPTTNEHTFLVDCAADHADEYLAAHGTLPPSTLLTLDTITLVVRHNERLIGALSTATTDGPDGERSEIDTLYIKPKYRGKKHALHTLMAFIAATPHTPYVRGPLTGAMKHMVDTLQIDTGEDRDIFMLDMVTKAFTRTVSCTHAVEPCRSCMYVQIHQHFAAVAEQHTEMIKRSNLTEDRSGT